MGSQKDLTEWLERGTEKLGTQSALARYLGVTRGAITHWKAGRTKPSYDKIMRLLALVKAALLIGLAGLAAAPQADAVELASFNETSVVPTAVIHIVSRLARWLRRRFRVRNGTVFPHIPTLSDAAA